MNSRLLTFIGLLFSLFFSTTGFADLDFSKGSITFWHDNDIGGDDHGYTGSINLEAAFKQAGPWTLGIRFYSGLYTQRLLRYGSPANPQYQPFTDWQHVPQNYLAEPYNVQDQRFEQDSIGSLFVEHHDSESPFSWTLEGGITQTESNAVYVPWISGLQLLLHGIIGATKYNDISDGKNTRYGLVLKPMAKFEENLLRGESGSLGIVFKGGGSVDTEGRREFLLFSAGSTIGGIPNQSAAGDLLRLRSVVETQLSPLHKQVVWSETLSLNFETAEIFLSGTYLFTKTGYTNLYETQYVDNDPIYRLGITFQI